MTCYFVVVTDSKLFLPYCMGLTHPCHPDEPTAVLESMAPTLRIPREVRFVAGCFRYVYFAIFSLGLWNSCELRSVVKVIGKNSSKSKRSLDPTTSDSTHKDSAISKGEEDFITRPATKQTKCHLSGVEHPGESLKAKPAGPSVLTCPWHIRLTIVRLLAPTSM